MTSTETFRSLFRRGKPVKTKPVDQLSPTIANDLAELLAEAGTEIFNAYGAGNPVAERLREMRDRIQQARIVHEA